MVVSTEFWTNRPIRTKLARECKKKGIMLMLNMNYYSPHFKLSWNRNKYSDVKTWLLLYEILYHSEI